MCVVSGHVSNVGCKLLKLDVHLDQQVFSLSLVNLNRSINKCSAAVRRVVGKARTLNGTYMDIHDHTIETGSHW